MVVAATPSEEFAWCVGGDLVRWGYHLRPVPGGTELTQTWDFLPAGLKLFRERYGADAPALVADRTATAQRSMPLTPQALKAALEARRADRASRTHRRRPGGECALTVPPPEGGGRAELDSARKTG